MLKPKNTTQQNETLIVKKGRRTLAGIGLACLLLSIGAGMAEVKPNGLFGDNMVLQRERKLSVWGTADAGEAVTVAICGHSATATADEKGNWKIALNPLTAGGPFEMTIVGKDNKPKLLKNVLIGDVWVCSGQSNMEFQLAKSLKANEEAPTANYPMIRHFKVGNNVQDLPQENVEGSWTVCNPQTVSSFTAVGYYFGRDLHKALNVPIGLLNASWSGSYAESWTSSKTLDSDPDLLPTRQRSQKRLLDYVHKLNTAVEMLKPWMVEAEKATSENQMVPPLHESINLPGNPLEATDFASSRYNGIISPLVRFPIRGVIWYQGESNVGRAWQYRKLLPALIADWRKAWGQPELPFYVVQLANNMQANPNPCDSNWAELREAQSFTAQTVPNSGMAVTIDVGEAGDIHPKNKQAVGARLALIARAKTYEEKIEYSGPQYESMKVDGKNVILKFQHAGSGLVAQNNEALKQFAIADDSKQFVWANAVIEGDAVVVSSDKVASPVAVRYAWQNNPEGCNLYNKEGLPASPFRTDDWPMTTVNKR